MRQRYRRCVVDWRRWIPLLLAALIALPAIADDDDATEYRSFGKALVNGHYGVTLNYRYEDVSDDAIDGGMWQRSYFNAFSATIGGGTSQIQANIVGERVLGLPKG